MKGILIFLIIISCLYIFTKQNSAKTEMILKSAKLSTFDGLWLSYIEGIATGVIIMLIIS